MELITVGDPVKPQPPQEIIYGQIVAKANNYIAVPDKATGGRRIIKSDKIRAYEKSFAQQCKVYKGKQINTHFDLIVEVYYKNLNYDLDNSLKTLLDCLQYVGAITDDKLCRRIVAQKFYDPHRPRVEFDIIADDPQPTLFDDL